jgi:hypothetical protein
MGSKFLNGRTSGGRFHDVPDCFGRDCLAPRLAETTYSPEDHATIDASRRDPHIDGAFRPEWNRSGPNMLSLANQVSNHAALLADLKVFRFESNKFGPSHPPRQT